MKLFTEVFDCRYPIVAMAMNQVSDLPLACAVRKGGALPSLSIFNHTVLNEGRLILNYEGLEQDLIGYCNEFGDCSLLLSLNLSSLVDDRIFEMLFKYKVRGIEVIKDDTTLSNETLEKLPKLIWTLRSNNSLIFRKMVDNVAQLEPGASSNSLNGFIVKGPDGAGRGSTDGTTLEESYAILKNKFPDKLLIPSGGIGTSEQVRWHMSNGAFAVGVGTVLAACRESKISEATKLKMVTASSADLSKLSTGSYSETAQNALVFSNDIKEFTINNTRGLIAGIKDPSRGHVFAGKSIDQITEILPAAEIIQRLAKDL